MARACACACTINLAPPTCTSVRTCCTLQCDAFMHGRDGSIWHMVRPLHAAASKEDTIHVRCVINVIASQLSTVQRAHRQCGLSSKDMVKILKRGARAFSRVSQVGATNASRAMGLRQSRDYGQSIRRTGRRSGQSRGSDECNASLKMHGKVWNSACIVVQLQEYLVFSICCGCFSCGSVH